MALTHHHRLRSFTTATMDACVVALLCKGSLAATHLNGCYTIEVIFIGVVSSNANHAVQGSNPQPGQKFG